MRSFCGDGVLVGLEQCDGMVTGIEQGCRFHGYYDDGPVTCTADCRFNFTACGAICGDETVDARETCDPVDLAEVVTDCVDQGYYTAGPVRCNAACQYDVSSCVGRCGDSLVNGPEVCDGGPPGPLACTAIGFDAGQLTCGVGCYDSREYCRDVGFNIELTPGNNAILDLWGVGTEFFAAASGDGVLHTTGGGWQVMSGFQDSVRAVWGSSRTSVFAVGEPIGGYGIYRFDGTSWAKMTTPTDNVTLNDVGGTGPMDVWAVGDSSTVLHYDGSSWTKQTTTIPAGIELHAVWAAAPNDVFVAGYTGGVGQVLYRYSGGTWTPQNPTGAGIAKLYGRSANEVYALDKFQNRIYRFNGLTWTQMPACMFNGNAVTYSGLGGMDVGGPVLASGTPAGVTTQLVVCWLAGGSWHAVDLGPITGTAGAIGGSSRRAYVGASNIVFRTDGQSWLQFTAPPIGGEAYAIWAAGTNRIFVTARTTAGQYLQIWSWDGTTWTNVAPATTVGQLVDIAGGTNRIAAVGNAGRAMTSPTGATGTWTTATVGSDGLAFHAVWSSNDGNTIYAVGDSNPSYSFQSLIGRYTGTGWVTETSGTLRPLRDVWGAGTSVFAVGDNGTILRKVGAGAWTPMVSGTTAGLLAIWGRSETDVYAVGGVTLHFDGTTWTRVPTDVQFGDIWGSGSEIYASDGTRLFHYAGGRFLPLSTQGAATNFDDITANGDLTLFLGNGPFRVLALGGKLPYTYAATEIGCANGWDDDNDGLRDCSDPDCAANPACANTGACRPIVDVACGAMTTGTTVGGTTWWPYYGAGCLTRDESGPEAYVRVRRSTDGPISLELSNYTANLDLVIAETTGTACTPEKRCLASSQTGESTENVIIAATANVDYIAIVDGALGASGNFTLRVACP